MPKLKVKIFGASHDEVIGVKIVGLPLGTKVSPESIETMLARRGASSSPWSTPRKEKDEVVFRSGVENGVVIGDVEAVIYNQNIKPQDYKNISVVPRPSHADYVSYVKYGKIFSGGGKWSGRLTAPMCIAGAIIKDALLEKGVRVGAYVSSIAQVQGLSYKNTNVTIDEIELCHPKELPTLSNENEMVNAVIEAKNALDSVGGTVECIVYGLPVGLGDNLFDGMESAISSAVFGVPGVKGVEFGDGFDIATMYGSVANDPFMIANGKVVTKSNHSGGINGGVTNGMPLTLKVALRPTPSIAREQESVDLTTMKNTTIAVKGRHDSCIVPRAVAAIESAVAIAVFEKYLEFIEHD